MLISSILPHLVLFLLFPIFIHSVLRTILSPVGQWHQAVVLVLSFIAGPAVAALLLELLYLGFPQRAGSFYSTLLIVFPIVGLTLSIGWQKFVGERSDPRALNNQSSIRALGSILLPRSTAEILAATFLFLIISSLIIVSLTIPLYANDPLGYQYVARLFVERAVTDFYPISTPLENGYYAVSAHPLVYYLLIASGMILSGVTDPYFIKHISPYYLLCGVALIFVVGSRYSRIGAWLGALLYVSTPLVFFLTYQASIDQIKNVTFFSALIALCLYFESQDVRKQRAAIASGFFVGLAMAVHSLNGLMMVPIVAALVTARSYLNFAHTAPQDGRSINNLLNWLRLRSVSDVIVPMFVIGSIATIVGGGRYISNLIQFGTPISDTLPLIARTPELNHGTYMVLTRDRDGLFDLIFNGVFAGLTNPAALGIGMYVALAVVLVLSRKALRDPIVFTLVGAYFLFHGFVLLLLFAGKVSIANNARYMLGPTVIAVTLLPFLLFRLREILTAQLNKGKNNSEGVVQRTLVGTWTWLQTNLPWATKVLPALKNNPQNLQDLAVAQSPDASGKETEKTHEESQSGARRAHAPLLGKLAGIAVFTAAFALLAYTTLAQCVFQSIYIVVRFSQDLGFVDRPHNLSSQSTDRTRKFFAKVQRVLPPEARVLYFRQSTFAHFLKNNGIRHVDPRLEEFYKAPDQTQAVNVLADLDISYVYMPGYALATGLHPNVWRLLSDPDRVELVAQIDGQRLFRIKPHPQPVAKLTAAPIGDVIFNNKCLFQAFGSCWISLKGDFGYFRDTSIQRKNSGFIGTTFAETANYSAADGKTGLHRFEVDVSGYGLMKIEARLINYNTGAPYDTVFSESWPVGEIMAIQTTSRYAGLFRVPDGHLLKGIRVTPKSAQSDLVVRAIKVWHVEKTGTEQHNEGAGQVDWVSAQDHCRLSKTDAIDSDSPKVGQIFQDLLKNESEELFLLEKRASDCADATVPGRLYSHVNELIEAASPGWSSRWRDTAVKISTYLGMSPNFPGRFLEIKGTARQSGHYKIDVLMRDTFGAHYLSSCGWLRHLLRGPIRSLHYKCSLPVRIGDTPVLIRHVYRRKRTENSGLINDLFLKFGDRDVVEKIVHRNKLSIDPPALDYRLVSLKGLTGPDK